MLLPLRLSVRLPSWHCSALPAPAMPLGSWGYTAAPAAVDNNNLAAWCTTCDPTTGCSKCTAGNGFT